ALNAISAADAAYGVPQAAREITLLLAVAHETISGLQSAVGGAIGALLARGAADIAATLAEIDGAIGVSGGLSSSQALAVQVGAAATAQFEAQIAIGVNFDTLIGGGVATQDVIAAIDSAIAATSLPLNRAMAVLVAMAANQPAEKSAVSN